MTKNSMIFVEILISMRFENNEEEVEQIFSFNSKNKFSKLLNDPRFDLYNTFKRKIMEKSVHTPGSLEFSRIKHFTDKTVAIYNIIDIENLPDLKNRHFNVVGYVPSSPGCDNCIYMKEMKDSPFIYCDFKQKTLNKKQKTCKWFKQKS